VYRWRHRATSWLALRLANRPAASIAPQGLSPARPIGAGIMDRQF
jgi:hypothetical protein